MASTPTCHDEGSDSRPHHQYGAGLNQHVTVNMALGNGAPQSNPTNPTAPAAANQPPLQQVPPAVAMHPPHNIPPGAAPAPLQQIQQGVGYPPLQQVPQGVGNPPPQQIHLGHPHLDMNMIYAEHQINPHGLQHQQQNVPVPPHPQQNVPVMPHLQQNIPALIQPQNVPVLQQQPPPIPVANPPPYNVLAAPFSQPQQVFLPPGRDRDDQLPPNVIQGMLDPERIIMDARHRQAWDDLAAQIATERRNAGIPQPIGHSTPLPGHGRNLPNTAIPPPGNPRTPGICGQGGRAQSAGTSNFRPAAGAQMPRHPHQNPGPRPFSGQPIGAQQLLSTSQEAGPSVLRPPRPPPPPRKGQVYQFGDAAAMKKAREAATKPKPPSRDNSRDRSRLSNSDPERSFTPEQVAHEVTKDEDISDELLKDECNDALRQELAEAKAKVELLKQQATDEYKARLQHLENENKEIEERNQRIREKKKEEEEADRAQRDLDTGDALNLSRERRVYPEGTSSRAHKEAMKRRQADIDAARRTANTSRAAADTTKGKKRDRSPSNAPTSLDPNRGAGAGDSHAGQRARSPVKGPPPSPPPQHTQPPSGDPPPPGTSFRNPYQESASIPYIDNFLAPGNKAPRQARKNKNKDQERSPSPRTKEARRVQEQQYQTTKEPPAVIGTHNARAVQEVPTSLSEMPRRSFAQPEVIFNPVHYDPTLEDEMPPPDGPNAPSRDLQSPRWWWYVGPDYYGAEVEATFSQRVAVQFVRRVKSDLGRYVSRYTPEMFFQTLHAYENVYRTRFDANPWLGSEKPHYSTASLQFVIRCRREMQRRLGEGGHLWHFMPRELLRPLNMERIWSGTTGGVFRPFVGFNNAFGPFRYVMDDRLGPAQARNANYNTHRWQSNPVIQEHNLDNAIAAMRRSLQIYRDYLRADLEAVLPAIHSARHNARNIRPCRNVPQNSVIRAEPPSYIDREREAQNAVNQQWYTAVQALLDYHKEMRATNRRYPDAEAMEAAAANILTEKHLNVDDIRPATGGAYSATSQRRVYAIYPEADGEDAPSSEDENDSENEAEALPPRHNKHRRDRTASRQRQSYTPSNHNGYDKNDEEEEEPVVNPNRHVERREEENGHPEAPETQDQSSGQHRLSDAPGHESDRHRRTGAERSRSPRHTFMDPLQAMARNMDAVTNSKTGPTISPYTDRSELKQLRSAVIKRSRSPPQRRSYAHFGADLESNDEVALALAEAKPPAMAAGAIPASVPVTMPRQTLLTNVAMAIREYHVTSHPLDNAHEAPLATEIYPSGTRPLLAMKVGLTDDGPPLARTATGPERRGPPHHYDEKSRSTKVPQRHNNDGHHSGKKKTPPSRPQQLMTVETGIPETDQNGARRQQHRHDSKTYRVVPHTSKRRRRSPTADPPRGHRPDSSHHAPPPPAKPGAGKGAIPRTQLPTTQPDRHDSASKSRRSGDSQVNRDSIDRSSSHQHNAKRRKHRRKTRSQSGSDSSDSDSRSPSPLPQKPVRKPPKDGDDTERRDEGKDHR